MFAIYALNLNSLFLLILNDTTSFKHITIHQSLLWVIAGTGICDLLKELAWIIHPGAKMGF